MPKAARLISSFKKNEVNKIFNASLKKIKLEWFDIILATKKSDFGRILVITSKKVGNAPKRNKIRRRLKSIFYEEKLFQFPYDCIIIIKKEALNLNFDQLKNILIKIIKNENN